MIHKQELRTLQPSSKPLAEIKIEIAFIMIKFEIHTLRTFTLRNSKREKFGVTRKQSFLLKQHLN